MANLYIIIRAFLKHFLNNLSIFRLFLSRIKNAYFTQNKSI